MPSGVRVAPISYHACRRFKYKVRPWGYLIFIVSGLVASLWGFHRRTSRLGVHTCRYSSGGPLRIPPALYFETWLHVVVRDALGLVELRTHHIVVWAFFAAGSDAGADPLGMGAMLAATSGTVVSLRFGHHRLLMRGVVAACFRQERMACM